MGRRISVSYKQYKLKHEQFIYCTAAAEIEDKWYKWCMDNEIQNPGDVIIYDLPMSKNMKQSGV